MISTNYLTSSLTAQSSGDLFRTMRAEFDDLQRQLATNQVATSYGNLGSGRTTSLDLHAKLASLAGYQSNIASAQLRLKMMDTSLTSIAKMTTDARTTLTSTDYNAGSGTLTSGQAIFESNLKTMIDALNTDVGGRYLFSGRTTDVKPVETYEHIMNGDGASAGVKTLVDERTRADRGTLDPATSRYSGRLTVSGAGTMPVTLTAQGTYGFGLVGVTTNGTTTNASGSPASLSVDFPTQPSEGQPYNLTLSLPDGTQETITLVARANPVAGAGDGSFAIGATPAETADNFRAALLTGIDKEARTSLAAASSIKASGDFFAGSSSVQPNRVLPLGATPETATSYGAPAASNPPATVVWYKGDDTSTSARMTATAQIGDQQSVATGAQANEEALRRAFTYFSATAAIDVGPGDSFSGGRYAALAERVTDQLASADGVQTVENISVELADASATLATAKDRLTTTQSVWQDTLGGIEQPSTEELAARILDLQTRMQASYQTTSILSKLTLTNYL